MPEVETLDEIGTTHPGAEVPRGRRDPELTERRMPLGARVDSLALFGQP